MEHIKTKTGFTHKYYAICGKEKIPLLNAYAEMYDEDHLMIEERTLERPDVFDISEDQSKHWVPVRTS